MRRRNFVGYAFISPWVIGFLIFTLFPFLASVYLSFTRYNVVTSPVWIGTANYRTLFNDDPLFWKALGITFRYALFAVPLGIIASVGLALLLNQNVKGMSVFRTIFFLPSIVPSVASSVVFLWLLNPQIGIINGILGKLGIVGPAWLGDTVWAPRSLILISLWGVGGSMVIYLAGLKDIPVHLYEAAILDGASSLQRLRHVTLPMLTPIIAVVMTFSVLFTFTDFQLIYVLTRGGPLNATHLMATLSFQRAILGGALGEGAALATAMVPFLLAAILFSYFGLQRRAWQQGGSDK